VKGCALNAGSVRGQARGGSKVTAKPGRPTTNQKGKTEQDEELLYREKRGKEGSRGRVRLIGGGRKEGLVWEQDDLITHTHPAGHEKRCIRAIIKLETEEYSMLGKKAHSKSRNARDSTSMAKTREPGRGQPAKDCVEETRSIGAQGTRRQSSRVVGSSNQKATHRRGRRKRRSSSNAEKSYQLKFSTGTTQVVRGGVGKVLTGKSRYNCYISEIFEWAGGSKTILTVFAIQKKKRKE